MSPASDGGSTSDASRPSSADIARSRLRGDDGFVLPAVLAILIVVSAAALLATTRQTTRLAVAESQTRSLRLQGLADGVARLLAAGFIFERSRGLPGLGLPRNGSTVTCPLSEGRRVTIALQDQAGLLDLNTAPRPLLEASLRAIGIGDSEALTLAAEIVDYRDPDETPEPNGGAEAPQYRARGLAYGPRDAPFLGIEEIERLPSMTAEHAARLLPVVTVYNPNGTIDPSLVPVAALVESVAGDAMRRFSVRSLQHYVEMRVVVSDGAGRASRSAMVSSGDSTTGTMVLSWQPHSLDLAPGPAHRACLPIAAALTRS